MTEESLVALLQSASDAYYNGKESPLDDETFDALVEQLRDLNPENPFLQTVGAPPLCSSTPLPSLMPSLDKIKPGMPALQRFLGGGGHYVASEKLDGLSALWCAGALYLRGDGRNGVSIKPTHIQGLVKGDRSWMIRGELIMQKEGIAVSRSIVNGLLHQSSPDPEKLSKVQFLAYEVVAPAGLTRSAQFEWLTSKGFLVPWWQRITGPTEDQLRALFLERRAKSVYETDGIVLGLDVVVKRTAALKNPKDCMAFKMPISEQSAVTTVREVLWAASAQGYLIPRLRFDPITVSGAVIEFCTAHNAKTVLGLGLGTGATVRIRRSGDVIPTIDEVIIPAKTAALPEGHEWDTNGVHIRLKEVSKEQVISQLHHFAKTMGIEGLGPASCAALVEGALTTPRLIWNSTAAALSAILGPKTGETLYKNLRVLKPTEIQLCVASSKLPRGVGEAKLQALSASHPDPRTWATCSLPKTGWTDESFREFQTAYGKYEEWRRDLWFPYPIIGSNVSPSAVKATVCFTGFRDKVLEEQLLAAGVATSATLTSKVSALIVADDANPSEKVKKAQAAGTEILTRAACIKKYLG
jgi:NAD-dependent DNA ligase